MILHVARERRAIAAERRKAVPTVRCVIHVHGHSYKMGFSEKFNKIVAIIQNKTGLHYISCDWVGDPLVPFNLRLARGYMSQALIAADVSYFGIFAGSDR
jgi:hypothetical protein